MQITHDFLVGFARSFGLFYLIAMSVAVTVYAFWPSLGKRFDRFYLGCDESHCADVQL